MNGKTPSIATTTEEKYSQIRTTNIVASGKLDREVNTNSIAQRIQGSIYHSRECGGLRIYLTHPTCSITLQTTGRISVMGTKSRIDTYLAFRKFVFLLNEFDIDVKLSQDGIEISNFVSTAQTSPVNLVLMQEEAPHAVRYNPKKFHHASFVTASELGYANTNVVIEIFQSGKCNVAGARSIQESRQVFEYCERILFSKVRIRDTVTTEVTLIQNEQARLRQLSAIENDTRKRSLLDIEQKDANE